MKHVAGVCLRLYVCNQCESDLFQVIFRFGRPYMNKFLSLAALSVAMVTLAGVVAQPLAAQ